MNDEKMYVTFHNDEAEHIDIDRDKKLARRLNITPFS